MWTARYLWLIVFCLWLSLLDAGKPGNASASGIGFKAESSAFDHGKRWLNSAQTVIAAEQASMVVPLVVDGAKTPQLVPDDLAYYHLFWLWLRPRILQSSRSLEGRES